jgi:hypothetical protein
MRVQGEREYQRAAKIRRPEQGRRLRKEEESYVVEPYIRGAVKVCDA